MLLHKVWFNIMLYFCRRGREGQRELRVHNFEVKSDDHGNKYIIQIGSEVTKNHQSDDDGVSGGIMYANNNEPQHCPVRSFELYAAKSNGLCDALFQRPRDNYSVNDDIWYENKPIGKNTLSGMMVTISKCADLSERYTNHCIRATSITILSEAGFNNRHIMSVSRHRNEGSISSYVRDTSIQQKWQMAETLASATMTPLALDVGTDIHPQAPPDEENTEPHQSELVPVSPLLSLSQEHQLTNDLCVRAPCINMPQSAAASLFSNAVINGGSFNIFLGQKQ